MLIPEIRTRWAEEQAEQLLAIPFIAEFVFRSPQKLDGPRCMIETSRTATK
jgi:hypothetical protein